MRSRFGRGRRGRGTGERRDEPIDAGRWFERLTQEGHVPTSALQTVDVEGVPDHFAAVGVGQTDTGERLVVAFAPKHGGDAALAALAHAHQLCETEGFAGQVLAVAPQWSIAARRRLSLLGEVPFRFRALAVSSLDEAGGAVESERGAFPLPLSAARLADGCESPEARGVFLRAVSVLEGLAAKHGGAVRGTSEAAELVLMARRCAALRPDGNAAVLETLEPEKATARLDRDTLAGAFDRLEGQLRKRLNDRAVKAGEEGLRAQALPALIDAAGLREALRWPLGGGDPEVIDVVGLDARGCPVVAVLRERLDLPGVARALDAFLALRPALPALFADAAGPLRLRQPRLALAAETVEAAARHALSTLALEREIYEVRSGRGTPQVVLHGAASGAPAVEEERPAPRGAPAGEDERSGPRRRRRRGGRSSGRGGAGRAAADLEAGDGDAREAGRTPRADESIEDMSLFDVDDEGRRSEADDSGGATRRRRRGRRRGGRRSEPAALSEAPAAETSEASAESDEDDLVDADEDSESGLAPLDDVPEIAPAAPEYEDEEEGEEDESEAWMRDRETRRLARNERRASEPPPEREEGPKPPPRRRSAIVAHADPDSVMAAILLARDIRMIEGFWVYPQEDLMTFFRSVATDLRGEMPVYVVGFSARPARDTIQAAALYSGRLFWYDHHDWPPEDLESMRQAIGADCVEIEPGSGSSIPAVLGQRARRSRFSDKLVELATGRFSQHDFERWGRLWAHRIRELCRAPGEKRSVIEPLLSGRPSDLAKSAAREPLPPLPREVAYVSERDFRVVHFGGFGLVIVPVPADHDPLFAARLARERFGAQVSLAYREGEDLVLLGSEEARGRGGLDLSAMVGHLAAKHEWITGLRDEDHVARLRVRDLATHPQRLDEVVAEVAMGRSLLEG